MNEHSSKTINLTNLRPDSKIDFKKSLKGLICCSFVKSTWLAMFCMILHMRVKPRFIREVGCCSIMPDSLGRFDSVPRPLAISSTKLFNFRAPLPKMNSMPLSSASSVCGHRQICSVPSTPPLFRLRTMRIELKKTASS